MRDNEHNDHDDKHENSTGGSSRPATHRISVSRPPSSPPPPASTDAKRNWYVRLCLQEQHIAKLWVNDFTPHNVLVWSTESKGWVPLLVVPELRSSVVAAHDERQQERVERRAQQRSSLPPPPPLPASVSIPKPPRTFGATSSSRPREDSYPELLPAAPENTSDSEPESLPLTAAWEHRETAPRAALATTQSEAAAQTPTLSPTASASWPPRPETSSIFPSLGTFTSKLSDPNAERLAWLALGVGLACIAMFLGQRSSHSDGSSAGARLGTAVEAATPSGEAVCAAAGSASPAREPGTLRFEDLPKEGSPAAQAAGGRNRTSHAASGSVATVAASDKGAGASRRAASSSGQGESEGRSINAAMARAALMSAASRARNCAKGDISGRIQVTFGPTGFVQEAVVLNVRGNEVRPACVRRAFQEVRVSPFTGDPVTVRKSF